MTQSAANVLGDEMSDDRVSKEQALSASRLERDRTLEAIHSLETSLGKASESGDWLGEVNAGLEELESAMTAEQRELSRPDALLAMIASENPRRFGPRIRSLVEQYKGIVGQVASLRRELGESRGADYGAEDLRHRAGSIIRALHNCRGRQADLVYDALRLDLGH